MKIPMKLAGLVLSAPLVLMLTGCPIDVNPLNIPPAPLTPKGPSWGYVGEEMVFSIGNVASASLSPSGYFGPQEFRFDWGDATYSSWNFSPSASKVWRTPGTYVVRAQARYADTKVESFWSGGTSVNLRIPPTGLVAGHWSGQLYQTRDNQGPASRSYFYEMSIVQNGATLSGTTWIAEYDTPQYFARMNFEGTTVGNKVAFSETNIVEDNTRPGRVWCIKSGELLLSQDGHRKSLVGQWWGPLGCGGEIHLTGSSE